MTIQNITWYRNGVCGMPFYVVNFTTPDVANPLVGIVFETKLHVAVINPADSTDRYRGDRFEDELRAACERHQNAL